MDKVKVLHDLKRVASLFAELEAIKKRITDAVHQLIADLDSVAEELDNVGTNNNKGDKR